MTDEELMELLWERSDRAAEALQEKYGPYCAAILRRYWYADSVEETAACLGWSVSKTKSALFRVRNRLREYLVKEGYLE